MLNKSSDPMIRFSTRMAPSTSPFFTITVLPMNLFNIRDREKQIDDKNISKRVKRKENTKNLETRNAKVLRVLYCKNLEC